MKYEPGQPLFKVPHGFWEPDAKPSTVTVVENGEFGPLAFDPEYGHNVYLNANDVFRTEAEAIAEIARRRAARDAKEDMWMEGFMETVGLSKYHAFAEETRNAGKEPPTYLEWYRDTHELENERAKDAYNLYRDDCLEKGRKALSRYEWISHMRSAPTIAPPDPNDNLPY